MSEQPKLLGFLGDGADYDPAEIKKILAAHLQQFQKLLGTRMIVLLQARDGIDLIFFKTCVEKRVPVILFLPHSEDHLGLIYPKAEDRILAQQLLGVALAKYVVKGAEAAQQQILEWADAMTFPRHKNANCVMQDARDLGLASCLLDLKHLDANWEIPYDETRKARHGFPLRVELVDFLDARYAGSVTRKV